MEKPVTRPPQRAGLPEPAERLRASAAVTEVRLFQVHRPSDPRLGSPRGPFHPRAFLEALLPPDYYLG